MICITNHTSTIFICQDRYGKHIMIYVNNIITMRCKQDLFKKLRQRFLPADFGLCVNNFCVDDFSCPCLYLVHSSSSQHRVFRFELLGHTFLVSHLLNQSEHHTRCLLVNVSKAAVQLAACEKRGVKRPFMFLLIAFVSLCP